MVSNKIKQVLEKQGYRFVGNHSACKVCEWTRKSLVDEDTCYKEQFYGIKAHSCCQMTPSVFCVNKCVFCWRDISLTSNSGFEGNIDEPREIIEGCIEAQRKLLSGFGGNNKTNTLKFKEAQDPKFFAISLTGEPTLYPKINSLITELHKRKCCSFLVTNGLFPKTLERLERLPTQLYISVDAPNKELYQKIDHPLNKNAWNSFNKTLELLPSLNTRKVLRITLIKDLNMNNIQDYASLIKKAQPDFVEVKAYMWVGHSKKNLELNNMPLHKEVVEFSKKLVCATDLNLKDQKANSRVVLLSSSQKKNKIDFRF